MMEKQTELFEEKTEIAPITVKESLKAEAMAYAKSQGLNLSSWTRNLWIKEIEKAKKR
ncbi:hypothetical protein [Lactococcus allomyrinae]|uniref:hypothetical protein n=1 Tax=Lactococcus allomyrinae TaxID=2419773 RepID=UPI0013C51E50|nr:hypothetical protein [Lactococcus allomyrinae]